MSSVEQKKKKRKFDEIEEVNSQTTVSGNSNTISYTIIWFDTNIDKIRQDLVVRWRLRTLLEYVETFNNYTEFKQFIQNVQDKTIYLILPIELTSSALLNLNHLSKSYGIYIYRENETDHSCASNPEDPTWLFTKIYNNLNELLIQLMIDTKACNNALPVQFDKKELTAVFGHLYDYDDGLPSNSWFQHLIRVLSGTKYRPDSLQRFVKEYRQIYQNNKNNLDILNIFEKEYVGSDAIRWYTKDCFLYHCLNKALRQEDIHTVFLLHFFIYDLSYQIGSICMKQEQIISKTVYRGQLIRKDELNYLNFSQTKRYIFINSFFSTTFDYNLALIFAGAGTYEVDDELQSVVFKINIEKKDEDNFGLYVNAEEFSSIKDENEILFTMGNAFVINEIEYDEEKKVWFIDLTLDHYGVEQEDWCDPEGDTIDEDENKKIRECCIIKASLIEATLIHVGYLLQTTVKKSQTYEKISNYYLWLKQCLPDSFSIGAYYVGCGLLALEQKRYQLSLTYQEKALKFYSSKCIINDKAQPDHYLYCIKFIINNSIGSIYAEQNEFDKAKKFYKDMLENNSYLSCFYAWTMRKFLNQLLHFARVLKECAQFESIMDLSNLLEQAKETNESFNYYFGMWLDNDPSNNMNLLAYNFLDRIPSIEHVTDNLIVMTEQRAFDIMEQNEGFVKYVNMINKVENIDILYARLGILYSQLKQMDLAYVYFELAIDMCPKRFSTEDDFFGYYTDDFYMDFLACCYKENNQFRQSISWYENAYKRRSQTLSNENQQKQLWKKLCLNIGDIYLQQKQFASALIICRLAQRADKKCPKVYEQLANIYEQMGLYGEAEECCIEAMQLMSRYNEHGIDVLYETENTAINFAKKLVQIINKNK